MAKTMPRRSSSRRSESTASSAVMSTSTLASQRPPLEIPPRPAAGGYRRPPRVESLVPDVTAGLS